MSITTSEAVLADGTWQVDGIHSSVGFAIKHMIVSTFRGRFERFDAKVETSDGVSTLTGSVDVASIDVRDADLAAHLQSPDFFDADRHPQVTFRSTAVRRFGDRVEIDGDLTIKGVTRPMTAHGTISGPAEDAFGGTRVGLDLETVIDRRAYGMEWNMPLPRGGFALGNDVHLLVNLELVKVA